jgi:magnesium transporter
MNFEYIPELKAANGYFILLGVMALVSVVLLMVFKKKRWL